MNLYIGSCGSVLHEPQGIHVRNSLEESFLFDCSKRFAFVALTVTPPLKALTTSINMRLLVLLSPSDRL